MRSVVLVCLSIVGCGNGGNGANEMMASSLDASVSVDLAVVDLATPLTYGDLTGFDAAGIDFALPPACTMGCGQCPSGETCFGFNQNQNTSEDYFVPTCLKVCNGPGDCPSGFRCFARFFDPFTFVCVSDTVPAFNCAPLASCDLAQMTSCNDPSTLAVIGTNDQRGLCGYNLVHCDAGCVDDDDGGSQGPHCL